MRKEQPKPSLKLAGQIRTLFGKETVLYSLSTKKVFEEMLSILEGTQQTIRVYLGAMVTRESIHAESAMTKPEHRAFRKALLSRLESADLNPNFWGGVTTEKEDTAWQVKLAKRDGKVK